MPRLTKIYTRQGDGGKTALGGGQAIAKDAPRIEAFGTVDELSSVLGVARACGLGRDVETIIARIQNDLFHLGSDLSILEEDKKKFAVPQIEARHVAELERWIDEVMTTQKPLENFILPAGTMAAAQLHVARTVCRRAERRVLTLARTEAVGGHVVPYLNRLSDLLFVLARDANLAAGHREVLWDSHR